MKQNIINILKKLIGSLDTHSKGSFSARKLTSLVIVISALVGNSLYYRYATTHDNWSLFPELKMIDYGMVALLLGLTTWEAVRGNKKETNGDKEEPKDNSADNPQ